MDNTERMKTIEKIIMESLFRDYDEVDRYLKDGGKIRSVNGINLNAGFREERIEHYRETIKELVLDIVPDGYFKQAASEKDDGGGGSYYELVRDRNEEVWTEDLKFVEGLYLLAKACGWAELCHPIELSPAIPGAPFIRFQNLNLSDEERQRINEKVAEEEQDFFGNLAVAALMFQLRKEANGKDEEDLN